MAKRVTGKRGAKASKAAPAKGGLVGARAAGPSTLAELTPDPQNARDHGDRNVGTIVSALQEVGAARSIVIDEAGVVLAGNATVEAAKAAGLTKVRVVDVDGDTVVAVRRSGLSADQKVRLALFDNRASELADGWNVEMLEQLRAGGISLDGLWTDQELQALLAAPDRQGLTDPDQVPARRATTIKAGDLFELGGHRLLCGDSTDPAAVARVLAGAVPLLMVTDPPYGVDYDPTWRAEAGVNKNRAKMGRVLNDDRADWTPVWKLFPGLVAYVWHGGLKSAVVEASLVAARFEMRAQIVWAKDRLVLSRGDYHWQHEPCWYAVRSGATGKRTADRKQATLWRIATPPAHVDEVSPEASTVWEIAAREDGGHTHGTQKPVECMARPMRNHLAPEVFEPFSGSGTTIIAAETLGRRCYAIELDPSYVQVAIDRWEAFTGQKAVAIV